MKRWMIASFVLLIAPHAWPDIGVFQGAGPETELWNDEAVQLVRESITLVPTRGPRPFDGTGAGASRFDFTGSFTLQNTTDHPVELQAGYPLDADFPDDVFERDKPISHWVAKYKFVLFEDGKSCSIRFTKQDRQNKHRGIFLWDMTFAPKERRTLQISCTMPLSVVHASTARDPKKAAYSKPWYAITERCLLESFSLSGEAGATWRGTIGEAQIRLDLKQFEDHLSRRGWGERESPRPQKAAGARFAADVPTFLRVLTPGKWSQEENGAILWRFQDAPNWGLVDVKLYSLDVPRTKAEACRLVQTLMRQKQALKAGVTEEDLDDLGDMLKAYYGMKLDNARIQGYLDNQVWYPAEKRGDAPADVLKTIASYRQQCAGGNVPLFRQVLRDQYDHVLMEADKAIQLQLEAVRAAHVKDLDDLAKAETQEGDPEMANVLREEKARVATDTKASLPATRVAGELAGPPAERITLSATLDGSGRFMFTSGSLRYEHFHWAPPQNVRIDGQAWNDLDKTPPRWLDVASRVSLQTVRILERSGRDLICVEPTANGFDVYVADSPNDRAEYSITLGFYPKRQGE
jgi:hypothetical protein